MLLLYLWIIILLNLCNVSKKIIFFLRSIIYLRVFLVCVVFEQSRALCVRQGNNTFYEYWYNTTYRIGHQFIIMNTFSNLKQCRFDSDVRRRYFVKKKKKKRTRRYMADNTFIGGCGVVVSRRGGYSERLKNATKLIRKIPVRMQTEENNILILLL